MRKNKNMILNIKNNFRMNFTVYLVQGLCSFKAHT